MVFLPSAELSRMRENQTFPVIKRSSPTLDFLVEVMGGPPRGAAAQREERGEQHKPARGRLGKEKGCAGCIAQSLTAGAQEDGYEGRTAGAVLAV